MKTETQHTPAPWIYDGKDTIVTAPYLNEGGIEVTDIIAFAGYKPNNPDARLIAAAPELLAMLQHAVELMEELNVGEHDREIYKQVIQKATKP